MNLHLLAYSRWNERPQARMAEGTHQINHFIEKLTLTGRHRGDAPFSGLLTRRGRGGLSVRELVSAVAGERTLRPVDVLPGLSARLPAVVVAAELGARDHWKQGGGG